MADNITLDPGSGGSTVKTDDDGSAHWQYFKIAFGADNTQSIVTSTATNPLPVALSDVDNAVLDTIDAVLDTINAKLVTGTVIGDVNVVGASLTALQKIDDAIHVDDAPFTLGTHSGVMMMGFAGTQSVGANDAAALACETDGALHIHDGGNSITVDGTVTANPASGTIDTVTTVGTVTTITNVVSVDDNAGSLTVDNAGLTELALAINSNRVDVNIAASVALDVSAATITVAAHAVTNAGTFAVQIVDTSFAVADGNALGEGVLIQGDDGTDRKNINVNATTGDVQVDITHTVIVDGSGVTQPISAASLPLPTSASTAANQTSVIGTDGGAGPASVLSIGGTESGGNIQECRVDSDGNLQVDIVADGAGLATEATLGTIDTDTGVIAGDTTSIDGKITACDTGAVVIASGTVTAVTDITNTVNVASASALDCSGATVTVNLGSDNDVHGTIAHDSIDAGNPLKIGAQAVALGASPTIVAAADRTDLFATRSGMLWTLAGHPNMVTREYYASTAQTDDPIVDSISAGQRIVVTKIFVKAPNSNAADIGVRIGFGTANVPAKPADGATVDGVIVAEDAIAAGSGVQVGNGSGAIGIGGDGAELRITKTTTQEVNVIVTYYIES